MGSELRRMPEEGGNGDLLTPLPRNRYIWFFTLAIVGLAIDLISKEVVFAQLGFPGGERAEPLFTGWIKFTFVTSVNEGALWGIGQGFTWLFALLSVVAIVAVSLWLFVFKAARSLWLTIALGLIMAGTLGNLYDRAGLHGLKRLDESAIYGVRDFLLFTFGEWHYPIFNLADCFLVIGAIMLGIQAFVMEEADDPKGATQPSSHRGTLPGDADSMQGSAAT